jgi:hypothetical protein
MVNIAVGCSPSLSNDELIDRIQRALDSEFNDDSFAVVKNSSIVDGPEKVFLTMIHNKENKNV